MRKSIIVLITFTLVLSGCAQIPTNTGDQAAKTTETPTPTPEITETPTPEPTPVEEENSSDKPEEVFEEKMAGVWGNLVGGCYFEFYEGTEVTRGWFESDALPTAHISNIEELSENKFKVTIDVDSWIDESDEESEAYSYEATIDGSIDGFKTCFVESTDTRDYFFIKLGANMDEAWDYYCGSFVDDYQKLAEEHKGYLREIPTGKWYTENYDETNEWATSYCIELSDDYGATCVGWRNRDYGSYDIIGPNKVRINFSYCQYDDPAEGGWTFLDGFEYTIDMEYNGDDATIKIDAPDVVSNLIDGPMHRKK